MKNNIKYSMPLIGITGVLFGRVLNRVLTSYIGDKGSNMAFAISGTIVIFSILVLIAMKYYMAAIISVIVSIPLIVGGIGLYFNNMDLVGLSILLMIIIYPITAKVAKKKTNK